MHRAFVTLCREFTGWRRFGGARQIHRSCSVPRYPPAFPRIIPPSFPQHLQDCSHSLVNAPGDAMALPSDRVSCNGSNRMNAFSHVHETRGRRALALALRAGWFSPQRRTAQTAPDYAALLAAPDRSDADRKPTSGAIRCRFWLSPAPRPGMKVLDMGAGGGYSTELMARAVAPNGVVYGQNPPDLGDKPKAAFAARMKTPAMKDAVADIAAVRRSDPARRARSRSDHVPVLLPRHDLHERRSRRDGPQDVRRAQARRLSGDCRSFGAAGPGHFGQQDAASHRRSDAAARKSRRPVSSSSPKAISGATPTTPTTSRATSRPCRSTISC